MKYKVSFSVTETYPTAEVEAKDRHEALLTYKKLYEEQSLGIKDLGIQKDARYNIQSVWKPNGQ